MTELLDRAMQAASTLPPEAQDDLARLVLLYACEPVADEAPFDLTSDEEAGILRSRQQALRGEFATEEQVRTVWAKHGL